MNPEKSAIKLDLLFTQGALWDDWLEGKIQQRHEMNGAIHVLKSAREKVVPAIQAQVRQDFEAGKVAALEGLQLQSYIMKQLERVELALENMRMNAERERIVLDGREAQLRDVIAFTKKMHTVEAQSLLEHGKAVEAGGPADGRPPMSAAEDIAQRRAEARAEKIKGGSGLFHQSTDAGVERSIASAPAVAPASVTPAKPSKKKATRTGK